MIGIIMTIPNGTQEMYDKVMMNLGLSQDGGDWPEGLMTHHSGPSGSDWIAVDTWKSKADFEKFFQSRLGDAVKNSGMPELQPKFFDIYLWHQS